MAVTKRQVLLSLATLAGAQRPAFAFAPSILSAETNFANGVYSLRWRTGGGVEAVDVYVSPDPKASFGGLQSVAKSTSADHLDLKSPLSAETRPYFYVTAAGGRIGLWTATRVVPLEGVGNFRDLGGYEARDGRHVVWGRIFRSNALAALTDRDYVLLKGLGVRRVYDLRTDQERASHPTEWRGDPPVFVNSAKAKLDFDARALFGDGKPDAGRVQSVMSGFYRTMIESYADEYKEVFKGLLQRQTPMIVHCTAGKDRTGLGAALILTALGVPRSTVVEDYALSGELLYGAQTRASAAVRTKDPLAAMMATLPPDVAKAILGSEPAYINAALDEAAVKYGSVDGYLEKRLNVGSLERAELRALYLQ